MIDLMKSPETFTSVWMTILVDRYGIEVADWDLETILMELKDDFRLEPPPAAIDKIAVGQLLLKTNLFHSSLPDFIEFCNVMNNETGLKQSWSPADPYEITWAVAEEKLLVNEDEGFNPEILAYMTTMLRDEGVITPPDSLTFIPSETLNVSGATEFSDDPAMFQACYEEGQASSEALQNYLQYNLTQWEDQMKRLQLKHGTLDKLFENN